MTDPGAPVREVLRLLALAQHGNALALRQAVEAARAAKVTWEEIGADIGLPYTTVLRQVQAESPVVVVRPHHSHARAEG